ncbi:DNA/RNA non-specific endonuclease [Bombilactobacillus thymidiniphilus]|uniref:DNA/RNA non-specific endonuclease n=1 Tax=Bombilactobacillus thymidiniphilus TaxID=2923363 RepID=A0ABY4PFG2_9LACO|nr:DNA/RNA non-specific endonuclease [Bombilactobacillus thymidiniphilus]UQS84057.1 DNA/RNA non-specific endonuclease [Bombilactobacillus thymidiniphilus]
MSKKKQKQNSGYKSWWILLVLVIAILFGNSNTSIKDFLAHLGNNQPTEQIANSEQLTNLVFDIQKYPQNYVILNNNQPQFSTQTKNKIQQIKSNLNQYINESDDQQDTQYHGFDHLGRTQQVSSFVRYKDVVKHSSSVMKRPAFPESTKVSGEYLDGIFDNAANQWQGQQSNNQIVQLANYHGYLYNKSHLLAWSLGGSMSSENVILGTRAQNVGTNQQNNPGGMAYTETKVRDFLRQHQDDTVFYQATPYYKGNELVARGVQVQVQSIKNPSALHLNVWTFNTQSGVTINYQNGQANV